MEDGLWHIDDSFLGVTKWWVLILVLMEDGLWRSVAAVKAANPGVLILVLMEDGLWHLSPRMRTRIQASLNPCFNGRWSLTEAQMAPMRPPCWVLILVLMEDGLWPT